MKIFLAVFTSALLLIGCKKESDATEVIEETAVAGTTTILVDETIFPIIEDVAALFENEYRRAKINLVSKSETEILKILTEEKGRIAIMAKTLDSTEIKYYNNTKQVHPRITEFGVDALSFIGNKQSADSTIAVTEIVKLLKGDNSGTVKSLVFDNPNSSTVRELKALAGISELPKENVFSMNSNKDVIRHVAVNQGAVGIIGINWLLQPTDDLLSFTKNVRVLGVENVKLNAKNKFIKPNQTNIADGSYPLTRKLYLLNFQGATGLGMGFASYLAGQQGQRIILKSGLVPTHFPTREIAVRNKVEIK